MIISRAAIMFSNGEVLEGHSYSGIATLANKLSFNGERIYGFVTSYGEFVLPHEAALIAESSGQISYHTEELKPEDIWPEYAEI